MSSSQGGAAPPMYFCHMCSMEIRPLLTPQPTCPRCNGGFVEEVESSRAEEDGEDDDANEFRSEAREDFFGPGSAWHSMNGGQGGGLDVGQLIGNVLRGLANAGNEPRREQYQTPARPASAPTGTGQDQDTNSSSGVRSGTTRLGPMNVSWQVASSSSTTFGGTGGSTSSSTFGVAPPSNEDTYVHDDGMGGAGGASDGRFFNFDNRDRNDDDDDPSRGMPGANRSHDEPNIPPELASLRDVFSNLFGGLGDGPAGMLMDLLGGAVRGGRSGDYVWGQQGLDDVISQLMEQTRGSTAPPPASDEAIAKLQRFSRRDIEKVRQARNRECSTCMDSFEDEGEQMREKDEGMDSNLPTGLHDGGGKADAADDPPEVAPHDEQQDALVMMPCHHLFHEDCLIPWLKTSSTCPVCRVSLQPKEGSEDQGSSSQTRSGPSAATASDTVHFSQDSARPASAHAQIVEEREDTDIEDDGEEEEQHDDANRRRERMRNAAEARMRQGDQAPSPSLPGSFALPPEDLD